MKNFSIQHFAQNFPITTILFATNIVIFILNHSRIIPVIVSIPGVLDISTFFAHFSHISLMHLAFNMLILVQISPLIERKIPKSFYVFFLILLWILLSFSGWVFMNVPALGFSGIGLGIITFCGLLYRAVPSFSKQILGWAGINIAIGLLPGISFFMHFAGALGGALLFGVYRLSRKK